MSSSGVPRKLLHGVGSPCFLLLCRYCTRWRRLSVLLLLLLLVLSWRLVVHVTDGLNTSYGTEEDLREEYDTYGVSDADSRFRGINETEVSHTVVGRTDQVCAMCTDGLVYVHLGRHALSTEQASAAPVNFTVAEELYVEPRTAPVFTAASGSAGEVVSRCLAQLVSLGQLGVSQSGTAVLEGGRPQLTASVIVDFDSASPHVSVGKRDRCPAFLAEVRPSTVASGTVKMEVSYPRLPSWPLPYALNPALHGGTDAHGTLPPYFGTVAVRETDVDKDVRPPLSVALTEDRGAVVIRFGEDETSTRPEPFEMRCPAHFMSVFIGRFGRQHNQVQELMHTLALAHRTNRTFVVPVLVPDIRVPFLRIDAQKVYGFNALRREGGYCLVTYEEARRMFKVMEAEGTPLTLRRFSYYGDPRACTLHEQRKRNIEDWWTDSTDARFNLDAWFEDSRARNPPVTTISDNRSDGMFFTEARDDVTAMQLLLGLDEGHYTRLAHMRKAMCAVRAMVGGEHRSSDVAQKPQPLLAVVSSRMAFYAHPSLREMTRAMGLLRPSAAINREADRYYSKDAAQLKWPTAGLKRRADGTLVDTLRPSHFKNVIGIHLRRRVGTCRKEAMIIDRTAYAIDPRFRLEQTEPSWSGSVSTFRNMELDCAISNLRVVELYKQYTRWMRVNRTRVAFVSGQGVREKEEEEARLQPVPTVYLAHGDEALAAVMELNINLRFLSEKPSAAELWGRRAAFPLDFATAYDRHIAPSFRGLAEAETAVLDRRDGNRTRGKAVEKERRVELVEALYDRSLTEIRAMAVDFFFMTNTGVFRGVTLSSVSTNVMMRRWGRGLPCHGVLAGYLVTLYSSTDISGICT